jgi:hypothetical protein
MNSESDPPSSPHPRVYRLLRLAKVVLAIVASLLSIAKLLGVGP